MIIINLFFWALFGLLIGVIAKFLTPGKDPFGWLKTISIGILGSYIGGFIKYLLLGGAELNPAGILFSVIGGVLFLFIWRKLGI